MPSKELEMIVDVIRSGPSWEDLSIEERRTNFETGFGQFQPDKDVHCQSVNAGGVSAEWISSPRVTEERVIFYLHGGGYVIGSINTHRGLASRLSRSAAARVLLIDYRLAPEDPFPAAVEDSVSAYRWLLSTGVNPDQIAIVGESAGGGLTVATLVALRDAGEPLPSVAVPVSPWVDMEATGESMNTKAEVDPMTSRKEILFMAENYLGDADPRTPLAAPLYSDLKGLPPLLIQVGTSEVLLDDALGLADKAKAAGVDVVLEQWEDMIHMWHFFPMLPEGQRAIDRIGEFVRKYIG